MVFGALPLLAVASVQINASVLVDSVIHQSVIIHCSRLTCHHSRHVGIKLNPFVLPAASEVHKLKRANRTDVRMIHDV